MKSSNNINNTPPDKVTFSGKTKNIPPKGSLSVTKSLANSKGLVNFISSICAIIVGLLLGFIILLISNPAQSLEGLGTILTGAFNDGLTSLGRFLYLTTPIILTGLSVGFAFKTGLFNIGTPGQFIVGGFGAVFVGVNWTFLPPWLHWIVALIAAGVLGGLWGLLPGLLKAFLNVNVVIATIMMNYIGMYLVNELVKTTIFDGLRNQSLSPAPSANIPKFGLDLIFPGSSANGGILIAILIAIIIYIVLNKTTFGYELKACGLNKNASKYAGINEKKNIVLSMVIAGALAGIGGGLLYLAGSGKHIEVVDVLAAEGFQGIPVALLGLSNPIGIIFSGLFISYITVGGFYMQSLNFVPEIIEIIIAIIIYFSAFALVFKKLVTKLLAKIKHKNKVPDYQLEKEADIATPLNESDIMFSSDKDHTQSFSESYLENDTDAPEQAYLKTEEPNDNINEDESSKNDKNSTNNDNDSKEDK